MSGKIYQNDNYHIIPTSIEDKPENVIVLDQVLLSRIHTITDLESGYDLAERKLSKTKEIGIITFNSRK